MKTELNQSSQRNAIAWLGNRIRRRGRPGEYDSRRIHIASHLAGSDHGEVGARLSGAVFVEEGRALLKSKKVDAGAWVSLEDREVGALPTCEIKVKIELLRIKW